MSTDEGKTFLMDRYLDELKHMDQDRKKDEGSSSEVHVLKEQLRVLSAEMLSLRQALGFHPHHHHAAPPCMQGSLQSHTTNHNQDSGYSDNLGECTSTSSSLSSSSSTSLSSTTPPHGSSCSILSCPCAASRRKMSSPLTFNPCGRLSDLVKMPRPVSVDAVCRALHQRWMCGECHTRVGPVLLALNPQRGLSQDQVLQHSHVQKYPDLQRLAQRVHALLVEKRRPQAIVLSGESGSGKTYTSQLFLRQLHSLCRRRQAGGEEQRGDGGISEQIKDKPFENLVNAFHVLRAVGCARTRQNAHTSRLGHHIEVQVTANTITKTKIQCHWFDQSRVVDTPGGERNFHIFYQMLAGLTHEERAKLHLHGYGVHNLAYLKQGCGAEEEGADKDRFNTLRAALSSLGIEFADVMRILAAILLLGNVHFVEDGGYELDIRGTNEIKAVASLLGVSGVTLYRALTTQTHSVKGQAVKTLCNADQANETRDTLAKALYCRMMLSLIKRINSVLKQSTKCPPYVAPSFSSEDTQSSGDSSSRLSDSTMELNGRSTPTEGSRYAEGTIHIIDMPGFNNSPCNRLVDLCSNYYPEVVQQVYLQELFRKPQETCREDNVEHVAMAMEDNCACLELLAAKNGLFTTIDGLCNQSELQSVDDMMNRINRKHRKNSVLVTETENKHHFTIRHVSSDVRYSAADFLARSRDVISDDVVSIFRRKGCTFGFATYLFAPELKLLQGNIVKGVLFRICPKPQGSSQSFPGLSDHSIGSLPIDCHHRLRDVVASLSQQQAQYHFIQCVKINDQASSGQFSHASVTRQVKALQVTATITHLTEGYPHVDGIADFVSRYRCMLERRQRKLSQHEQCTIILEQIKSRCELIESVRLQNKWIVSENRVFFSEETRQALEQVRSGHRDLAARFLQSKVRCWVARRHWPSDIEPYEECKAHHVTRITFREPVYERMNFPISSNSSVVSDDASSIECKKARIQTKLPATPKKKVSEWDVPPPLPSNHPTASKIDTSQGFPQTRIMRCSYSPGIVSEEPLLRAGEPILVMGVSNTKDLLIVEHNSCTLQIPLKLTMMQTGDRILGTRL